jgi:hypothetical protein
MHGTIANIKVNKNKSKVDGEISYVNNMYDMSVIKLQNRFIYTQKERLTLCESVSEKRENTIILFSQYFVILYAKHMKWSRLNP